jgi:hypothetical protein
MKAINVFFILIFSLFFITGCYTTPPGVQYSFDQGSGQTASVLFDTSRAREAFGTVSLVSFQGSGLPKTEDGKNITYVEFPAGMPLPLQVNISYVYEGPVGSGGGGGSLLGTIIDLSLAPLSIGSLFITGPYNSDFAFDSPALQAGNDYKLTFVQKRIKVDGKLFNKAAWFLVLTDTKTKQIVYEKQIKGGDWKKGLRT